MPLLVVVVVLGEDGRGRRRGLGGGECLELLECNRGEEEPLVVVRSWWELLELNLLEWPGR